MHEKEPRVHQVVDIGLELVAVDVVPAHLDVRGYVVEEPRVQVDGDDGAGGTDTACQPTGDGAGARADFEAAPTRAHADPGKVASSDGVRPLLEEPQSG